MLIRLKLTNYKCGWCLLGLSYLFNVDCGIMSGIFITFPPICIGCKINSWELKFANMKVKGIH
jgi:hypothetical protein